MGQVEDGLPGVNARVEICGLIGITFCLKIHWAVAVNANGKWKMACQAGTKAWGSREVGIRHCLTTVSSYLCPLNPTAPHIGVAQTHCANNDEGDTPWAEP